MTSKNAKTILDFLAKLALLYSFQTFQEMEIALFRNLEKWGYQFVAEQCAANPKETEISLFRERRVNCS